MSTNKTKRSKDEDKALARIAGELDAIKRLLVALLRRGGVSQGDLAAILRIGQTSVSRMIGGAKLLPPAKYHLRDGQWSGPEGQRKLPPKVHPGHYRAE